MKNVNVINIVTVIVIMFAEKMIIILITVIVTCALAKIFSFRSILCASFSIISDQNMFD